MTLRHGGEVVRFRPPEWGQAIVTPDSREHPIARRTSRVLVVEDDAPLRQIISRNLTARGHKVRQAADASEALDALKKERPDLLILDINLPDRTGWDVLREAHLPEEVRVVALTAVDVSPRRLAELRPLAYLPKPFPLEALLRLAETSARTVSDDAQSIAA